MKQSRFRHHLTSHGQAWLDFLITTVAVLLLVYGGMKQGAELLAFKWAQVAASQIAAHVLLIFLYGLRFEYRAADRVDKICVIALRLGFAYCFAVGG